MEKFTTKSCKNHGDAIFVLEGRGTYRCRQCRIDAVTKRRKGLKEKLAAHLGGKCQSCDYNACLAALDFHHPDDDKEFAIAARGLTLSWERMRAEAEKCVLLCCRCHREIHAGKRECPTMIFGS
jgi:hypothetical protein